MPTQVSIGNVFLAASAPVTWRLVTGVTPYQTSMSVHQSDWPKLEGQVGQPLTLRIDDARGVRTEFREVYILHKLPSSAPKLVTFLVADKRWLWSYKLIVRDYNVPRKTGDRTAKQTVPVETTVTIDQYTYRKSSLKNSRDRWGAQDVVRDVLDQLEPRRYLIDSWPVKDAATPTDGVISVQNLLLRDQGDSALSKVLQMIPGAEVYVGADGVVRIFDGTDLDAVDQFARTELPPLSWDGNKLEYVDRKAIRPREIHLYYQREVEALFSFSDDFSGQTSASLGRNAPFIENVIPTVDPSTRVSDFDPERGITDAKTVPMGTWVEAGKWLSAMNASKPATSPWEWTFANFAPHWVLGDIEAALGGKAGGQNLDVLADANVMARIQALKQHFRQTFRVNRRYMERVRDMQPVRVGVLDPVTGARATACAWSQGCLIPTTKGMMISSPGDASQSGMFRNVDMVSPNGSAIIDRAPSPVRVDIVDKDLGIFRLEWIESPYGTVAAYVPCNLVDERGTLSTPWRDLSDQDTRPTGMGVKIEGTTTGISLSPRLTCKTMVTIVPCAPNNQRQYLRRVVKAEDISALYRKEFRIKSGRGPVLSVFVAPGELTARYAFTDEAQAATGIQRLLGLDQEETDSAGIDGEEIPGYTLTNGKSEIEDHALSYAAELFAQFADSTMGQASSSIPSRGLKLVGNIGSVGVSVQSAPSGKCLAVHDFTGYQRVINRIALLPDSVRNLILGILPNGTQPAR